MVTTFKYGGSSEIDLMLEWECGIGLLQLAEKQLKFETFRHQTEKQL